MEDKKEGEVPRVSDRKNGWGIDITRGDEKKKSDGSLADDVDNF